MSAPLAHLSDGNLLESLTPVEREVLSLYCSDLSLKQIAFHLSLTPKEVADHKYVLMGKLGVKSNLRLVVLAVKLGLITDDAK